VAISNKITNKTLTPELFPAYGNKHGAHAHYQPTTPKFMKPKFRIPHPFLTPLTLASALAALFACHSAQAMVINWTGATSTLWSLDDNWVGLVAPADSLTTDSALFSGTPPANLPALTANRSVGGLQFGATGGWTLGGGSILSLGNIQTVGSTTGVGIDASALNSGTDTISCNITLGTTASQTWLVGTGGTLNVTGVVAKGTGSSILNVGNTSNGGTLVLGGTGDNNSLGLNITNGIIVLNKTSNSGVHALGVDTTVSGGTLQLAGTGGDQIYYNAGLTVNSAGTLDMNGRDEGIRALASASGGTVTNGNVTASTLTVTAGGSYAGAFTGNLSVIVGGAGNSGGSTFSGSVNNAGTITDSGTGTNATTISGPIGANVTGVIQNSATSALSLSGANVFTSGITIKAGTVNVRGKALGSDNAHNVGTITLGNAANTGLAATLNVNEDGIGSSGAGSNPINVVGTGTRTISVTSWNPIFSGAVTLNSTDLKVITNNTGGSDMTLSGGFTGAGNLVLQSNAVNNTKNSRIELKTNTVNNTGTITNSGTGTITTGNINTTISAAIGSNVTGVIQNSANSVLYLSGPVAYSGNTTVNAGTLRITNINANNAKSTVTIDSSATLQLDFSGTNAVSALIIGGSPLPAGIYKSSTNSNPGTALPQITGPGTLTVGGNYASWAKDHGIEGQPATGDYDHDGLTNLMEYGLGLNPAVSSPSPGTLTNNVLTFNKDSDAIANGDVNFLIEESTDLLNWLPRVTQNAPNTSTSIAYTLTTGLPKVFARLRVSQVP
jgi:autotransporter-associated beta strand protein